MNVKQITREHYKLIGAILLFVLVGSLISRKQNVLVNSPLPIWNIRSIDTMKYSRDASRETLSERDKFQELIETQVGKIAGTGANYVAIATPYDDEFLSVLRLWVIAARKNNLKVWFRGNWAGWEGWFGFSKIDRATHIQKTKDFILKNTDLFLDGDIFNACPECENGGPGDPRNNGDVNGHRKFIIDEYKVTKDAFAKIGKNVASNYFSMNGDVAKLVMDKDTTKALDGLVVVDHYVKSTDRLASDIKKLAQSSGGKIVLGEFGAPIPDIHGKMDDQAQAEWVVSALDKLSNIDELVGVNYWVGFGGSTEIWNTSDGFERTAVSKLRNYFSPKIFTGRILNTLGKPIDNINITYLNRTILTKDGTFGISFAQNGASLYVSANGYKSRVIVLDEKSTNNLVYLDRENPDFWWKVGELLHRLKIL